MKKVIGIILLACALSSRAEWRIWEIGDMVTEAEFVSVVGEQVVLRLRGEREVRVKGATLSAADQRYVLSHMPPKLDINVTKVTGKRGDTCKAAIKQTDTRAHPGHFEATLFVIGKDARRGGLILMSATREGFNLETLHGEALELESQRFVAKKYKTSVGRNKGAYDGYMVVVKNQFDEVVCVKASRPDYENELKKLLAESAESLKKKAHRLIDEY